MNPISEHFKLVRIVVICVALVAVVCALGGIFLAIRGFNEATMLIQASATATGGLLGLVSLRGPSPQNNVAGDATINQPPTSQVSAPAPTPAAPIVKP